VARRSLTILAAALAVLVLVGSALAASNDPQIALDPADQAWAQSIVIGASDLGKAWSQAGAGGSSSTAGTSGADASCAGFDPDFSDLTVSGNQDSPTFTAFGAVASSEAIVWSTADQAQAAWDRENQPGFLACVSALLKASSTKHVKLSVGAAGPLSFPSLAPRTAAYRLRVISTVKVKLKGKTRTVRVGGNLDLVLLGSGRVNASVTMFSADSVPLDASFEQQLATTVAGRLSADPRA